jgi:hypothetical protein
LLFFEGLPHPGDQGAKARVIKEAGKIFFRFQRDW